MPVLTYKSNSGVIKCKGKPEQAKGRIVAGLLVYKDTQRPVPVPMPFWSSNLFTSFDLYLILQRNKPIQITGLGKSHPCPLALTTLPNRTPLGYLPELVRLFGAEVLWDEELTLLPLPLADQMTPASEHRMRPVRNLEMTQICILL